MHSVEAFVANIGNKVGELLAYLDNVGYATVFRKKGVTGARTSHSNCPIANYLRDELAVDRVEVGTAITIYNEGRMVGRFNYGEKATKFIQDFDAGRIPDLIS